MSDWLESMFKLPLEMARVGFDQFEKILDERTRHADNSDLGFPETIFPNDTKTNHPYEKSTYNSDFNTHFTQPNVGREDWGVTDLSRMVVIGDSLAAGVDSFSFSSNSQRTCFAAQIASHIGVDFEQVLIEAPGLEFNTEDGVSLPDLGQSTVFEPNDSSLSAQNFSLPGFSPLDFLAIRKNNPCIQPGNPKQTIANLILQRSQIDFKRRNLFETALNGSPSFFVFAIGMDYFAKSPFPNLAETQKEVVKPLLHMVRVCDKQSFKTVVLSIPNPLDTAAYSDLPTASRILKVPVSFLKRRYGLDDGDHLTVSGIMEIGAQIVGRCTNPLKSFHVVHAEYARSVGELVVRTNEFLKEQLERLESVSYLDMHQWFCETEKNVLGPEQLTTDFLGGLFSLNGFTLTSLGQQLFADRLIEHLNRSFGGSIPPIAKNLSKKPVGPSATYRRNSGCWSDSFLQKLPSKKHDNPTENRTTGYRRRIDSEVDSKYNLKYRSSPAQPLSLPPNNEQTIEINQSSSYHSDAMRVINCEPTSKFGSCENNVFDGLALFGGALAGKLHFSFENPVDGISRFEITLLGPMKSFKNSLNTPGFLHFPLSDCKVAQPEGGVCRGMLDIASGNVFELELNLEFQNTGLAALQNENPQSFPRPAVIKFKSNIAPAEQGKIYSTAFARFFQRDDGLLDFVFHGTAFVPMGPGFRFALPIESPDGSFPTVAANGTQLHPHIHLSTIGQPQPASTLPAKLSPQSKVIPTSSTIEFVADTSQTCFGDDFQLNHPELGFARGRSRLAGRMKFQFGEQFGDLVPFSCAMLPPGGLLRSKNLSPLQDMFPGKLRPGMEGHDTVLRFPLRTYRQNDLYLIDDPFDIAIGAVNVYTGEVVGDFMHRAFLGQALFYSLVRLEPRTPQGSFQYRGPAFFERLQSGELRFRFNGTVFLPYQEGFSFPLPDGANAVQIGENSRLDPYFQVDAIANNGVFGRKTGGGRMQLSTMAERFSYQFSISNFPSELSTFSYTNHSQNGTFEMTDLVWASFMHKQNRNWKTATFTGLGKWSLDPTGQLHFASVQFSDRMRKPFASILIDQGSVSNVSTQPDFETPPLTALTTLNGER